MMFEFTSSQSYVSERAVAYIFTFLESLFMLLSWKNISWHSACCDCVYNSWTVFVHLKDKSGVGIEGLNFIRSRSSAIELFFISCLRQCALKVVLSILNSVLTFKTWYQCGLCFFFPFLLILGLVVDIIVQFYMLQRGGRLKLLVSERSTLTEFRYPVVKF